jgi:PHD/YefM family antitoxin component YafN of YafNO toxin-antitoxin module
METTAMIRPEDIGSLTDFNRNTKAHLKRLKRTGRPELLTVNGKAEVVVQNASAYQRLLQLLEKLQRGSRRKDRERYNKTLWQEESR